MNNSLSGYNIDKLRRHQQSRVNRINGLVKEKSPRAEDVSAANAANDKLSISAMTDLNNGKENSNLNNFTQSRIQKFDKEKADVLRKAGVAVSNDGYLVTDIPSIAVKGHERFDSSANIKNDGHVSASAINQNVSNAFYTIVEAQNLLNKNKMSVNVSSDDDVQRLSNDVKINEIAKKNREAFSDRDAALKNFLSSTLATDYNITKVLPRSFDYNMDVSQSTTDRDHQLLTKRIIENNGNIEKVYNAYKADRDAEDAIKDKKDLPTKQNLEDAKKAVEQFSPANQLKRLADPLNRKRIK